MDGWEGLLTTIKNIFAFDAVILFTSNCLMIEEKQDKIYNVCFVARMVKPRLLECRIQ